MKLTNTFFAPDSEWNDFVSGIYANLAPLGWNKTEIDNTDLDLLLSIVKKLRGETEIKIAGKEIESEFKKAKEKVKKWQKNSG